MLEISFKVLFTLTFLVFSSFIVSSAEAKSKIKLSEKYKPPGNPGGASFYEDEDFAESYKLYEKRRELLRKKKLQGRVNTSISKENLAKKLEKKKIAILKHRLRDLETCMAKDEKEDMINQHGINIARLKGATFIDQGQIPEYKNEKREDKQQKEKKLNKALQEKKNSPINVTTKNTLLKKTCSHDSITDLNNEEQHNSNGSDLFRGVADTAE
ncbi:TRP75-related protein [Wolbachia endosymbiont of Dirofilaria (Dirofilaria) immitis]|uniref:TRP75-related protein n=1 Tax=Wolbachia endosymbiont of Dirofilaria (Dirofilaria) immitis TaxID=1812115 RepID=UPI00158B7550|nr:TRP75-related protein [Wolbachia endosymbiont of Dirofilaria (Dirofilaria) immitis]QKX02233.1 hypothetical protein GOY12_01460 [Wolbachia endosymbiont of Dirofilaria (Dirofilaria) immitis]